MAEMDKLTALRAWVAKSDGFDPGTHTDLLNTISLLPQEGDVDAWFSRHFARSPGSWGATYEFVRGHLGELKAIMAPTVAAAKQN